MKFKQISQILQYGTSQQRHTVWSSMHVTGPLIKLQPHPLNPWILSRIIFPGTPVQFVTAASLYNNQNKGKAHGWFSCTVSPPVLGDIKLLEMTTIQQRLVALGGGAVGFYSGLNGFSHGWFLIRDTFHGRLLYDTTFQSSCELSWSNYYDLISSMIVGKRKTVKWIIWSRLLNASECQGCLSYDMRSLETPHYISLLLPELDVV